MNEILIFAILGLGSGAIYGLGSLSLVLVYRASGVVHFASGAVGMVGAFAFYLLRGAGVPLVVALVLAFGAGVLLNVAFYAVVVRRLRNAQPIIQLVASLAFFAVLYAWALGTWGGAPSAPAPVLPKDSIPLWGNADVSVDRLILLGVGVVLTAVLVPVYRYTRFGKRTTAVAEGVADTHGVSRDFVALINWGLAGFLSVLAAIMIVNIVGLSVTQLSLMVVPFLVAAVVGGFRSFWLALAGGLLIGVLQSELTLLQTSNPSWPIAGVQALVSVIVVVVALLVRNISVTSRTDEDLAKPPMLTDGKIRWVTVAILVVAGVLLLVFLSPSALGALSISAALGIICLSVVVVSGYAGQISLAQMALAGLAGWVGTRIVMAGGGFLLGAVVGVITVILVGLIIALPAVRVRGMNLAIVTLTFAVFIEQQFLDNSALGGGQAAAGSIGSPDLFGFSLSGLVYPVRWAVVCVVLLAVTSFGVMNLRRGRSGRRLIAVRTNERAASALGINVPQAKLYAFALAAALAGVGGLLITYSSPIVQFVPMFSFFHSISIVLYTVIGGIGYVAGAIMGGLIDPLGLLPFSIRQLIGTSTIVQVVLGLLLLVQLSYLPNGGFSTMAATRAWVARLFHRKTPAVTADTTETADAATETADAATTETADAATAGGVRGRVEPVAPVTLELSDVSVSFGGVHAVKKVSFQAVPGQIVGLIGPNGAGKTTVIDAATGFVHPQTGRVLLNDQDVMGWPTRRRARAGLGRSFQSLELFDAMTVRDNIVTACERRDLGAYVTDLFRPGKPKLSPVASSAIDEFGLTGDLDTMASDLSFGRRRLVAIARAVAANPSVLLLDEPAAGLDENETAELGRLVRRLADDWLMTIVLVEHDVGLVMDVCDQIVVLEQGAVIASGTPEQVAASPQVKDAYFGDTDTGVTAPEPETVVVVETVTIETPDRVETVGAARVTETPAVRASVTDEQQLQIRGLTSGYGDLPAVRDIDLTVNRGEVVLLIGPNGAGKSTTLKTICGVIKPMKGDVLWKGTPTKRTPLYRRVRNGLAYVPEERNIVRSLSVQDHFVLGGGNPDIAYEYFPQLAKIRDRAAGLLSGGERQMLVVGAALARKPEVLVIDELSLGLAPIVVDNLMHTIRTVADTGVGVLLVDQHITSGLTIADRAYVMARGNLLYTGTATETQNRLEQIKDVFVGTTNQRTDLT
ncbi:ATP-binding cassette domain-containing protein, partial [Microbacterium sp. X-17]